MDIIKLLTEAKRRTALMNSIALNWPHVQNLIPKVLNESKDHTPEFKENARILEYLLDDMEVCVKELRAVIPKFED